MMSAKIATLGLLKIDIFWKIGYEVIFFVHGITEKKLSRDANNIVNLVMWSKFCNSSISMKEDIINSIL